jgi:RNA polymerase sigma-70 factor (ECF subfamily)
VQWCESLYDAEAARLVLYGRALGLSHSEAEDVLQETFAALLEMPAPPELPRAYLVRAFRNRALNYRRSLWRRLARELEAARWFEEPDAAHATLEKEAMRSLAGLPAEQREVIVLKVWHCMTFLEVGELLGISPHTAAGRYRYGLQKLRAALEGTPYEQLDNFGETPARLDAAPAVGKSQTSPLPAAGEGRIACAI